MNLSVDVISVARLVTFDNSVRLLVELFPDRQAAHRVREQITVKSFDFPDPIADVHGLCRSAHLAPP
jgi:hypothetical protein